MAIVSLDGYLAAPKRRISYTKTGSRTTVSGHPFSLFDLAGNPPAGTLAAGNTANGIVPIQGQAGYPPIVAFGGLQGYLSRLDFGSPVANRIYLNDILFKAGAYAFNSNVTLASQPSYASRVPSGTNFSNLEIWVEQVTAATGNQAVNVFYTNQNGVTGRETGVTGIGVAPIAGRCWQLPLQADDSGVQRIERVVGSTATVGTFNVMVLRRLCAATVVQGGHGETFDLLRTGMPWVHESTALYAWLVTVGTISSTPMLDIEIALG